MPIRAFLEDQFKDRPAVEAKDGTPVEPVFGPDEIKAMSLALDDVCKALNLDAKSKAREIVAIRIIELARRGERSHIQLRDRILREANGGTRC